MHSQTQWEPIVIGSGKKNYNTISNIKMAQCNTLLCAIINNFNYVNYTSISNYFCHNIDDLI